ncbi:MAG TPA: thiamine phosphate synthase [Vicinamibacterales bacterium]|nr:thiamine phosphate synthase [Vicinamibacterales bacterium]
MTDRRRRDPVEQARAAAAAGVDLIQVRERDLDGRTLAALVRAVLSEVNAAGGRSAARVVVNDRVDIALACGAHGVHLRSDSIDAAAVRTMAPSGFLVGRSVHAPAAARSAGPVDYLVAGTVFRSASKDDRAPLLGIEGLSAIVRASGAPVLAIGGITAERLTEIAASGAAGIAAIGLFAEAAPLAPVVADLRARFDSVKTAP